MTEALTATDNQSKAVQVAPRVSKNYIESQITRSLFVTGLGITGLAHAGAYRTVDAPAERIQADDLAHHTICVLTTASGFTVIGHSAPASPENFNAALGEQYAYENAFRQLWPLFAFAMLQEGEGSVAADRLNQAPGAQIDLGEAIAAKARA